MTTIRPAIIVDSTGPGRVHSGFLGVLDGSSSIRAHYTILSKFSLMERYELLFHAGLLEHVVLRLAGWDE